MKSLADHGCIGINSGINACHFFQEIRRTKFEAVINVVWAQPEWYGKDFYATVSYLAQMVAKNGYNL